jgi:hypothetical protein
METKTMKFIENTLDVALVVLAAYAIKVIFFSEGNDSVNTAIAAFAAFFIRFVIEMIRLREQRSTD